MSASRIPLSDAQRERLRALPLAPGHVRYAGVIGASVPSRVVSADMPSGGKAHAYADSLDWMEQIPMPASFGEVAF